DKKIQMFVATPPEMLLLEAQEKAKQAESIKDKIDNILPELKALYKDTKQKPVVKVFEGKQGLINSFEDTLTSKEKIMRVASSAENLFKLIPDYLKLYVKKRMEIGLKMYGIHPDGKVSQELDKITYKFDKSIFIPKEKYKFQADIAIYDNKIGYIYPAEEGLSMIIESKEMSDAMKDLFDLAYEEAKRLNKKSKIIKQF